MLVLKLIQGGVYTDERGSLSFVNDCNLEEIKRFYTITDYRKHDIRAWQGHQIESKIFLCLQGAFRVYAVKIDDWQNPSDSLEAAPFNLSAKNNSPLFIPAQFANGLISLEANSRMLVFSDKHLKDSLMDKIRFDQDKWVNWAAI